MSAALPLALVRGAWSLSQIWDSESEPVSITAAAAAAPKEAKTGKQRQAEYRARKKAAQTGAQP